MKTLSKTENFLGLDDEWSGIERAKVVILPAPYEWTSSYVKGAQNAPRAILYASQYVELYDEELNGEPYKWTNGIATLVPMRFDESCKDATAIHEISKQVQSLLDAGKFIVTLGGEHTIAVGAVNAHSARYKNLSVLQLDAHADLRQQYEENPYSHASTMARIYEFNKNIVQVGIRSLCVEEKEFIQQNEIETFYAYKMKEGFYKEARGQGGKGARGQLAPLPLNPLAPTWHDAVINRLRENVYLTLDCDYFDPSVIPSLGTPEPGGFSWDETLRFLKQLTESKKIVGFDVSEISPANFFSKKGLIKKKPVSGLVYSEFTIAKLIYKLIGYIFR